MTDKTNNDQQKQSARWFSSIAIVQAVALVLIAKYEDDMLNLPL